MQVRNGETVERRICLEHQPREQVFLPHFPLPLCFIFSLGSFNADRSFLSFLLYVAVEAFYSCAFALDLVILTSPFSLFETGFALGVLATILFHMFAFHTNFPYVCCLRC